MLHALKTETEYFKLVIEGAKTFDVRKFDRPFQEGDDIVLQEYYPNDKAYTGEEWFGEITHVMTEDRFCKKGYCILSIKPKNISTSHA